MKHKNLMKKLKIKFILYFILTFILVTFFWFYVTCFCGVYINTQIHLIKDSLISFLTSQLIPLLFCFVPCIL